MQELPVAFADVKVALSPSIVRLQSSFTKGVLRVISGCSFEEVVRVDARRIIAGMASKLPFLERAFEELEGKPTDDHVLTIYFNSAVAARVAGACPEPAGVGALDMGIEVFNWIMSSRLILAGFGAESLSMCVTGKDFLDRGFTGFACFVHFANVMDIPPASKSERLGT